MAHQLRFDDRVAIVTGGGNELGRSHALLLASRGAKIVVNDYGPSLSGEGQSSKPADDVVAEIKSVGGTAIANYDSVHTSQGAQSILRSALDHFGQVDILVCNAGILIPSSLEETSDDTWHRTMGVHLDGTMFITRSAWPHFKERGYGRVIFTSSSGAMFGQEGLTAYGAAKGGIFGFMRSLAQETGRGNSRVNAILPGAATRMVLEESHAFWDSRPGLRDPAHVSALVAVLGHESCEPNGRIYAAGAGSFALNEVVQGKGIRFDYRTSVTPEQVSGAWAQINNLTNAETFTDSMAHGACMFNLA